MQGCAGFRPVLGTASVGSPREPDGMAAPLVVGDWSAAPLY